ncbi:hypothetical protein [Nocardia nova]|uniref:hypothetical protein n=1 Tax=Nocardia nova TaxID=37330 RepID=UPI0034070B36
MASKKSFQPAHSKSKREAAVEMLRAAAKEGKTQAEAARHVAGQFSDAPPLTTLLTWARRDGIEFTRKSTKKSPAPSAEVAKSGDGTRQPLDEGSVKKPTYSEEFRAEATGKVAELMDREGLTLHAATLRLREREPDMPSEGTLRKWVNANAGPPPTKNAAVAAIAVDPAPAPAPAEDDPVADIDEGVDELVDEEDAANPVRPDASGVHPGRELVESPDFLVRYEQLVKENEKLRHENARLAQKAEKAAKLDKEVAALRFTVRKYFEILETDDENQDAPSAV